ncbi:MAG: hypothetical protein RL318_2535, partial [Fibrobacterota bacterium]
MDIWAWVETLQDDLRESGYERLADLVDQIQRDVGENNYERAQAALPEALAGARAIKNPWLEVYLRHWGMQNRMNNIGEGETALGEATSLLEFAHRKETVDCPQSVCVTQDISKCYGNVDGIGWAQDRLDVCRETMARITPEWPCFDCLSREYSEALIDQGKAEESIAFLEEQAKAMADAGEEIDSRYRWQQADSVWKAGRPEEALALYQEIDEMEDGAVEDDRIARYNYQSQILSELGRTDEALEILSDWKSLTPSDYVSWSRAVELIVGKKPETNTWSLGQKLQHALDHLVKVGAHRNALDMAERHGWLACGRGARETARRALAAMEACVPRLRVELDARERVAALAKRVESLPDRTDLPAPAAELVAHLRTMEERDPEREIEWLMAARLQLPDDMKLLLETADALKTCALGADSQALLWQALEAHRDWRPVIYRLQGHVLKAADARAHERLLGLVEPTDPATACWIRMRWAFLNGQWTEVGEHAVRMLAIENDDDARDLWAQAAMKEEDFETAVRLRKEQLASTTELNRGVCWDLLCAASAAGEWETVREYAVKLGMELEGTEGPIEEDWGRVMVAYEEDGKNFRYVATRTGPVTATIEEPAPGRRKQKAGDRVVFNPRPQEEAPEDEEEKKHFLYTYGHLHTVQAGAFERSWLLDGAQPTDKTYASFRDALWGKGWACWMLSREGYEVNDPTQEDEEAMLPGMLVLVAAPKSVPALEIHEALKTLTKRWKHPLCWRELAEHVDRDVAHHLEVE